jgi:hypothetical protein
MSIVCNCGEEFETACDHAAHKLSDGPGHVTVCSGCESEFPEMTTEYVNPEFDANNNIVAAYCNGCWFRFRRDQRL